MTSGALYAINGMEPPPRFKPGDMVIDTIADGQPQREVRRLVMHSTAQRPIAVVLKVPGRADQVRSIHEVRPVEPAVQRDLLAAQ